MPTPLFRRARLEDLPAIVALYADDDLGRGREDASLPLDAGYLKAFAQIESDANQLQAVAVIEQRVVGVAQMTFIPGLTRKGMTRVQVEGVRIHRDFRGSGLGEAFFAWMIEQARERGAGLMQLSSDKRRDRAHRFYESLGFTASHEGLKLSL